MTASTKLPHPATIKQISKHGVLVLHGFGISVRMDRGHLLANWGVGLERYQVRLSRVDGRKLRRVVLIGSDGYCTLEAIRFISDVGGSLVMLDKRGKVIVVCGPVSPSDSKLRRAQALALGNGTALKISKELISQKLAGQELLVRDMLHDSATADAIARFRATLPGAESVERVTLIEALAAKLYWHSWADLPILWPRKDEKLVPDHWKKFRSRISPITRSPRLATTPANALINLLYSILESEARLAATAMGLDASQGFLHVDTPNRDSLACDLMEVCRPGGVDAFVLNWLQNEPLRRSDFWEDRNGNCRIASSLAIKLCETSDTWRRLVAPVAEHVAQELWASVVKPNSASNPTSRLIATRLTQSRKRSVKGSVVPSVEVPKPDRVCRVCGTLVSPGRSRCADCEATTTRERMVEVAKVGRMTAHAAGPLARLAETQRRHALARWAWQPSSLPAWLNEEVYERRIQPLLRDIANPVIMSALGVSVTYAVAIRAGRRRPHPRHWLALSQLVGISGNEARFMDSVGS